MSDISPRRRWAGRSGIAAALLALPLTASVCYSQASAAPEPPVPALAPNAPEAPLAPQDPEAPPAPPAPVTEWEIDEIERDFDEAERDMASAERELESAGREMLEIERDIETTNGERVVKRKIRWNGKDWSEMTPAEREKAKKRIKESRLKLAEGGELRNEMDRLRRDMGENGRMHREISLAVAEAHAAGAEARAEALSRAPRVVMKCRDDTNYIATEQDADGRVTMFVCEANADKLALGALRTARSAIATDRNLTREQRAEALRSIDEEIAELES